jgi:hypothetical protein
MTMADEFDNAEAARRATAAAEAAMNADEDQGELFPSGVMDGGKTTLKTLVKPGQGHKTRVALSRAEVPLRGGLPDPDRQVRALVTGIFQNERTAAERDNEANPLKVTGWKTTVNLRIEYVEHVPDTDAGLIEQRFKAMLEIDPRAAGVLLDQLKVLASEQLAIA